MKYTKGELQIELGKNSNDTINIYTGKEGSFDNIWIADIMGSHVGPIDNDERMGNAKLFIKAGKMYETLKEQIELEKADAKYVHSAISQERHQKRYLKLESLLKEIGK